MPEVAELRPVFSAWSLLTPGQTSLHCRVLSRAPQPVEPGPGSPLSAPVTPTYSTCTTNHVFHVAGHLPGAKPAPLRNAELPLAAEEARPQTRAESFH